MPAIVIVSATAIFVLGFALGVIFLVSHSIRQSEKQWRDERARWEEENRFRAPGEYSELPPTPITRPAAGRPDQAARGVLRLWVRRQYGTGQPGRPAPEPGPSRRPYPQDDWPPGGRRDRVLPPRRDPVT